MRPGNPMRCAALAVTLASAPALAGCMTTHSCTEIGVICGQTNVTVSATNDAWAQGAYKLALDMDGQSATCTLQMPASPPSDNIAGDCGLQSSVTMALVPLVTCPQPVCGPGTGPETVCSQKACTPVPGHYQLSFTLPSMPAHVTMNLTRDGKSLLSDTLTPQAKTTEPNGVGCGTCTNASATASTTAM